ncbi:hypothetical protein [Niabella sp.]|uniref:hypothetical protein n=1 Tax=Niabella sp. TaxID=1962976 RepID=UPI0026171E0D|nr:hypothetical protein [Niabella sp.]
MRSVLNTKRLCTKKHFYVTGFLLFNLICFDADAQTDNRKHMAGIITGGHWMTGLGLGPQVGLEYERKFTKHSSLETAVRWSFYRMKSHGFMMSDGEKVNFWSRERYNYYSMPVLYKYTSRIVNLAGGPLLNIMTGKMESNQSYDRVKGFAKPFNTLDVGYQFKVGKAIRFKDQFVLEPEVGMYKSGYSKKHQLESNIALKYRF